MRPIPFLFRGLTRMPIVPISAPMPAPIFSANADYTVIDRNPLVLEAGAIVRLGPGDRVWPGWVSVTREDGRSTYVPESRVEPIGDGIGRMKEPFDATDLSVRKGEKVVSLLEIDGWHWARGAGGGEGWIPAYVMDPV